MNPILSPAGADALLSKPAPKPLLFVVWFRRRRGEKWKKVAQCGTSAEANDHCRGSGDYWVAEIREPQLATGLFDEPAAGSVG